MHQDEGSDTKIMQHGETNSNVYEALPLSRKESRGAGHNLKGPLAAW